MSGAIEFQKVGMCYRVHREKVTTLKEAVLHYFKRSRESEELWALRDVSVSIAPGESVGLIGHNGSGKSTLLKLAAGVMRPSHGAVKVDGRVSPMIELAVGFDPELSGRDNIFLNGALLGYSRKLMQKKFERIVEFSELGDFIDLPVKNYSSGMYARLGFAIATDVEPEILLIDEILGVGDEAFQLKCKERMEQIRARGCTIVFVSHGMEQVAQLCPRTVVLQHGSVAFDGPTDKAIECYRSLQHFVPPAQRAQSA